MGYYDNALEHHGILGQKWGVRRFENKDGTLTAAGRARYDTDGNGDYKKLTEKQKHAFSPKAAGYKTLSKVYGMNEKTYSKSNKTLSSMNKTAKENYLKKADEAQKEADEKKANRTGLTPEQKKKVKTAAIVGAAVVGTALAAYGGYKLSQVNKEATKGLSDKYEKLAKLAFADSANMHGKSLLSEMNAVSAGKDSKAYDIGKDAAKSYKKASDAYGALGEQLRTKSKSKDYSVKEKVDFIKEVKNTASDPNAGYKMYEKAKSQARTVTPEKFSYETFKPAQFNFDKFGYEKFQTAAQANDDLVKDLLKRNGKALGM